MQFGAMNFPILPVLEEIDSFARLQFDYLELAMDPPMAHYSILLAQKKEIAQALTANNLGIVCHLPTFVSTADLTESIRLASTDEMRQSLNVAAELGAKKVVLHPSMVHGMGALALSSIKQYSYDFLAGMAKAAQEVDITICLENMFPRNIIGVEPNDLEEIFNTFPSLQFTFDSGHANIDDWWGSRSKNLLKKLGSRIGHIHFSDNYGKNDDHLPVGNGTVPFRKLIKILKMAGYDETITLEVFDSDRRMLVESRERINIMLAGG